MVLISDGSNCTCLFCCTFFLLHLFILDYFMRSTDVQFTRILFFSLFLSCSKSFFFCWYYLIALHLLFSIFSLLHYFSLHHLLQNALFPQSIYCRMHYFPQSFYCRMHYLQFFYCRMHFSPQSFYCRIYFFPHSYYLVVYAIRGHGGAEASITFYFPFQLQAALY